MRAALALACNIPIESLWAIRIDPATRITLRTGRGDWGALWGEIVETVQPDALQP
jgi:alpha-ribazole phosphatase